MSLLSKTLYAVLIFALIVIALFFHGISTIEEGRLFHQQEQFLYEKTFGTVVLEAKAAYVFDATQKKVLYEKNGDQPLPLASLAKIMTAITALDAALPTDQIQIAPLAIWEEGDSGLVPNETWQLSDILSFMLVTSSNDAAAAVAISTEKKLSGTATTTAAVPYFLESMNAKAEALGLSTLHFTDPTGLDQDRMHPGAVGSARDVAALFQYGLANHYDIFKASGQKSITVHSMNVVPYDAINTNKYLDAFAHVIASKTGYTLLAGGNLVVAFETSTGHQITAVVLGSSPTGRFTDMALLGKATEEYVTNHEIFIKSIVSQQ